MTLVRFPGRQMHLAALSVAGFAMAVLPSASVGAAEARAPAPVGAEPQSTTSTYGDWTVRCLRTEGPNAAHACEAAQLWSVQGQQAPIAQITVGRPTPKEPMRMTIQVPSNISFPSTVKILVDDKDAQPVELIWKRCLPSGCFADAELKDDAIKRFRAQTENGKVLFKDGAGRDTNLPFSFRGFPQALDGLAKSM